MKQFLLKQNGGVPTPLLVLVSILTGVTVANCYYCQPLLSGIAKEFDVSNFLSGLIATLMPVGYVLGLVFVIPLGDFLSQKKVILLCYAFSCLSMFFISTASAINQIWIVSVIAGTTSVIPQFFIPLVSYCSLSENKVKNVGILQFSLLLGILGSRVISGFIAEMFGWRWVFLMASVLMCFCWIAIFIFLPNNLPSQSSSKNYFILMESLPKLLMKYKYLRIASVRAAFAYGSFFALWSCISFHMKKPPFSAGDNVIGALGLCGLAGAFAILIISKYVQKLGIKFFSVFGSLVLLGAWLIAFGWPNSYLWLIVAILLIDAGVQCVHLANQASIVSIDETVINRINSIIAVR